MQTELTSQVFDRVADVPVVDWNQVVGADDLFMRLPMIQALEDGWGRLKNIWPVVFYDRRQRPQAVACLFGHSVDMATIGNPTGCKWVERGRRIYPGFMHVNTLVCGIPFPVGQSGLRFAPGADRSAVTTAFSQLLRRIAWRKWFQAIVIKDADSNTASDPNELRQHGFLTTDAPPMNVVYTHHGCLDDWLNGLRSHYRYAWRKSLKKLDREGLHCQHFIGEEILDRYDSRLHQLYRALAKRQQLCLERMPCRFFSRLVEACGDQVHMTTINDGSKCVAYCWSIRYNGIYQNLLCGFDRQMNRSCDLYFNLAIRDMGFGLQTGAREIWLGQTADKFKARLGATIEPRQMHVRCIPPVTMALRASRSIVFPRMASFSTRRVQKPRRPMVAPNWRQNYRLSEPAVR